MYLKLAIAGIAALAIVSSITLGYRHYTGLLAANVTLEKNNAVQGLALSAQDDTIKVQGDAISEWKLAQDELIKRVDEAQQIAEDAAKETRRLNDIFSKHDLAYLARKKPGLIERRLNTGTRAAQRMLECASGAEDTDCPPEYRPPGGTPTPAQP